MSVKCLVCGKGREVGPFMKDFEGEDYDADIHEACTVPCEDGDKCHHLECIDRFQERRQSENESQARRRGSH